MRLIDADALRKNMEFICMGIMAGTEPYNAPLTEIDNAPTAGCTSSDDSTGKPLTLGDLLRSLRAAQYERVEIRDNCGNEILTCPADSAGIAAYLNYHVTEWFPHGAPNKDATFTVYVEEA